MPNKDGTGPAGKGQSLRSQGPQPGKRGGCNRDKQPSGGRGSGTGRNSGQGRGQGRKGQGNLNQ
jgi:hypothetical protein